MKRLKDSFGGKCIICGYKKCQYALDFHHVDPKTKYKHNVTKLMTDFGFARAVEESKKCVLVCSNCHREIHAGVTKSPLLVPSVIASTTDSESVGAS